MLRAAGQGSVKAPLSVVQGLLFGFVDMMYLDATPG